MSAVYFESSAVLSWLLGEPGASNVVKQVNQAKAVVTSVLTILECERAVIRAESTKMISAAESRRLLGMLTRAKTGWLLMEISERIRNRAARTFPVEPVRTLDAIHLATALELEAAFPDLRMLSLDRRILDNVEALGIG